MDDVFASMDRIRITVKEYVAQEGQKQQVMPFMDKDCVVPLTGTEKWLDLMRYVARIPSPLPAHVARTHTLIKPDMS